MSGDGLRRFFRLGRRRRRPPSPFDAWARYMDERIPTIPPPEPDVEQAHADIERLREQLQARPVQSAYRRLTTPPASDHWGHVEWNAATTVAHTNPPTPVTFSTDSAIPQADRSPDDDPIDEDVAAEDHATHVVDAGAALRALQEPDDEGEEDSPDPGAAMRALQERRTDLPRPPERRDLLDRTTVRMLRYEFEGANATTIPPGEQQYVRIAVPERFRFNTLRHVARRWPDWSYVNHETAFGNTTILWQRGPGAVPSESDDEDPGPEAGMPF